MMHPLKKDEYRIVNRMKYETKSVLAHLESVAESSGTLNYQELEKRLGTLLNYGSKLKEVQEEITLEIQRNL